MFHQGPDRQTPERIRGGLTGSLAPRDPLQLWLANSATGQELSGALSKLAAGVVPRAEIARARVEVDQAREFSLATGPKEQLLNFFGRSSQRQSGLYELIQAQESFIKSSLEKNREIAQQLTDQVANFVDQYIEETPDLNRIRRAAANIITAMQHRKESWKRVEAYADSLRPRAEYPMPAEDNRYDSYPRWQATPPLSGLPFEHLYSLPQSPSAPRIQLSTPTPNVDRESRRMLEREQRECYSRGRMEQERLLYLAQDSLPGLLQALEQGVVLGFRSRDGSFQTTMAAPMDELRRVVSLALRRDTGAELARLLKGVEAHANVLENQVREARKTIAETIMELLLPAIKSGGRDWLYELGQRGDFADYKNTQF